jgi:hypothetical protein
MLSPSCSMLIGAIEGDLWSLRCEIQMSIGEMDSARGKGDRSWLPQTQSHERQGSASGLHFACEHYARH